MKCARQSEEDICSQQKARQDAPFAPGKNNSHGSASDVYFSPEGGVRDQIIKRITTSKK